MMQSFILFKKLTFFHADNSRGSSLIEVLVVIGLMAIISSVSMSMIANQNKQVKSLSDKLLTRELESQLNVVLSNSDYCQCLLTGRQFNTIAGLEGIISSDQLTHINSGYSTGPSDPTPCTPSATDLIPPVGFSLPSTTMTVQGLGLKNMSVISPGRYGADIEVSFANTVFPLKPIQSRVFFAVDLTGGSGPESRPFLNCENPNSGGSGNLSQNGWWVFPSGLMLQWGRDTIQGDDGTHTFARPFPNECFMTIITSYNRSVRGQNGHNHVGTCTTTDFTATTEFGPNVGAGWIAVGY